MLAEEAAQDSFHVADDRTRVEHGERQDLLSREGEQLPREICSALARAANVEKLLSIRLQVALLQQRIAVHQHDHHQVVEVVRDTAGQPAGRLEPLGFAQPLLTGPERLLRLPALGHVSHDDDRLAVEERNDPRLEALLPGWHCEVVFHRRDLVRAM